MIIKRLALDNIRSYVHEEIIFPEGTLLLAGDIGSGKSTVLLAIEFALFGIKRDELEGEQLLRHGKNEGHVELHVAFGEKECVLRRTLKRTKDGVKQDVGSIIVNGQQTHASPVELKSKILELLGYPKSLITKTKDFLYRYTVYTPQEEMKRILSENKEYRLDTIRKIFNIDKYKRVRDNIVPVIKELKTRTIYLEEQLSDQEEKRLEQQRYQEALFQVKELLKEVCRELQEQKQKIAAHKEMMHQHESAVKHAYDVKKRYELATQQLETLQQASDSHVKRMYPLQENIASLEQKICSITVPDVRSEELEQLQHTLDDLQKNVQAFEIERNKLVERQASLAKEISTLSHEITDLQELRTRFDTLEKELSAINLQIKSNSTLQQQLSDVEPSLQILTQQIAEKETLAKHATLLKEKIEALDQCPTCLQQVTPHHKNEVIHQQEIVLQKEREEKEHLLEEYAVQKKKHGALQSELEALRAFKTKKSELDVERTYLAQKIENMKHKQTLFLQCREEMLFVEKALGGFTLQDFEEKRLLIKEFQQKRLQMLQHYEQSQSRNNARMLLHEKQAELLQLRNDLEQCKSKIELFSRERDACSIELQKLLHVEETLRAAQNLYDELCAQEKKCAIQEAELKQRELHIHEALESVIQVLLQKEGLSKELQHFQQLIHWLNEFFTTITTVIEKQVLLRTYHEFNQHFSEWLHALTADEMLSARLDEEFAPMILQNGYETSVENLSGGERTAVALAYRLALNKVINEYVDHINTRDIIILDEPTDGFSSEQLDRVRWILQQINARQIILVSHETKIESFVEHIIRVAKEEHVSRVIT